MSDPFESTKPAEIAPFIGKHFIRADHGGRSRAEVLKLAVRQIEAT